MSLPTTAYCLSGEPGGGGVGAEVGAGVDLERDTFLAGCAVEEVDVFRFADAGEEEATVAAVSAGLLLRTRRGLASDLEPSLRRARRPPRLRPERFLASAGGCSKDSINSTTNSTTNILCKRRGVIRHRTAVDAMMVAGVRCCVPWRSDLVLCQVQGELY